MDYKELADRLEKRYKANETGSTFVTLCSRRDVLNAATAITDLLARAEAAEARVRELETSFRTEKCENGPECAELGRARKRAEAAEARCRLAEKCFDDSALHACETQLELEKKARAEAEVRAEKAERERDAAIEEIPKICYYCKRRKGWRVCEDWNGNQEAETCEKWEWRGQKEE